MASFWSLLQGDPSLASNPRVPLRKATVSNPHTHFHSPTVSTYLEPQSVRDIRPLLLVNQTLLLLGEPGELVLLGLRGQMHRMTKHGS